VIGQILREEIVKESVTYQDILQQGLQQGRQEESRSLILKLLKRRVGTLPTRDYGSSRRAFCGTTRRPWRSLAGFYATGRPDKRVS